MCCKKTFREDKRLTGFILFFGIAFLYLFSPKSSAEVLNKALYGNCKKSTNNQEVI